MSENIRALQGEDMLEALFPLGSYAFYPSPPFQNKEEWLASARERKGVTCHAYFEAGEAISIAASTAMTQNIREKLYPASGVWGVATHPSTRRKGLCRQVVASLLHAEYQAGKVFTNLYPFRESFYERLGYVAYPLTKHASFSLSVLAPVLKIETGGDIELKLIGEAFQAYRQFLAEMRSRVHGMAFFDVGDQANANRNRSWMAAAIFAGKTEGLMLYRLTGDDVTQFTFDAFRFYAFTSRARMLLLNWIARHIDQANTAKLRLRADEYPETWISDIAVKVESDIRPAMGRILDVRQIGGMSVGSGAFTAHISDTTCPWNSGTWHFQGKSGILEVTPASAGEAECELTIQALSALVSGTMDPQDFSLRGWGNPNPLLQGKMRQLFPRQIPFLHEMF